MLKPNVPSLVETGQSDTVQISYNSLPKTRYKLYIYVHIYIYE